jgi:hypothetical protein
MITGSHYRYGAGGGRGGHNGYNNGAQNQSGGLYGNGGNFGGPHNNGNFGGGQNGNGGYYGGGFNNSGQYNGYGNVNNNDSGYTDWSENQMTQENTMLGAPDRLGTSAMAPSTDLSEKILRPRLGSKRGRNGTDNSQDGATATDSPPRTRSKQ